MAMRNWHYGLSCKYTWIWVTCQYTFITDTFPPPPPLHSVKFIWNTESFSVLYELTSCWLIRNIHLTGNMLTLNLRKILLICEPIWPIKSTSIFFYYISYAAHAQILLFTQTWGYTRSDWKVPRLINKKI